MRGWTVESGGEGSLGLLGTHPDLDVDARLAQYRDTCAADLRVGVLHSDDDPPDAGGDHRFGARWRKAVMGAGLERHVQGRTTGAGPGEPEGDDLRVGTSRRLGGT